MPNEWQAIDKAPKDGTVIILATSYWVMTGSWYGLESFGDWRPSEERIFTKKPTHWMPLPGAPKEKDNVAV